MANASPCPGPDRLQQVLLGQLADTEAEPLEEHVRQCGACAETARSLQGEDVLLKAMRAQGRPAPPRPAGDLEGLMARLQGLRVLRGAGDPNATPALAGGDTPASLPEEYAFLASGESPEALGKLGPYQIRRVLGTGGMGIVFEAIDTQLERRVALKVMSPALAGRTEYRERFLREARAAAALDDEHVVVLHQVGEDRGVPYLAMELLEGETLEDLLTREGPLPLPEILELGRQMAQGLAAVHGRGLIHRDIKPVNVWLEGAGRLVKLLDFGLARPTEGPAGLTEHGDILGTPGYMAPEQAHGRAIDHRADLFSLGCVLYRMCTGAAPFKGDSKLALVVALEAQEPVPPRSLRPDLPPALDRLIRGLLAKRPEDRPASAGDVLAALDAAALPARRSPPWARLAGAAVLVALLASAAWLAAQIVIRVRTPRPNEVAAPAVEGQGKGGRPADRQADARVVPGEAKALEKPWALQTVAWSPRGDFLLVGGYSHVDVHTAAGWERVQQFNLHKGEVTGLAVTPDGKHVVSCGVDRTLRVWSLRTGWEEKAIPTGGACWCLALAPDGGRAVVGINGPGTGTSPGLRLYDLDSGKERAAFRGHTDWITGAAFTPDGKQVLSTALDGTLRVWDAGSGEELYQLQVPKGERLSALAASPDGKLAVTGSGTPGHAEMLFSPLRIWNLSDRREVRRLEGHGQQVHAVTFSAAGRAILSGSGDGTIRLWDLETGRQRAVLRAPGAVLGVALAPDGRLCASVGRERTARVWRLPAEGP